jgi:gliding motility-associated-like protein
LLADTLKKQVVINPAIPGIRYAPVRVVKNKPATIEARNIGQQYSWQPPGGLSNPLLRNPVVTTSDDQQYTIRIVSAGGCISVDTVLVQAFTKADVFVPKAFTPNSNNNNDLLRPLLVNIPEILYFRVYNRWGQIVFQTTTPGDGWNGIYKNSPQPMETYTWVFEGRDADGNIIKTNGKTLLIR